MDVISVINLKGGTGKTVTACNLAAILAGEYGRRVLVIDADPQHNASTFWGVDGEAAGTTTASILEGLVGPWEDAVTRTGTEGVDIVPADLELIQCDIAAVTARLDGSGLLRGFCDALREDDAYDSVIIDCPPSFTAASVSAVAASDRILIPVKIDAFALGGVAELYAQILALRRVRPDVDCRVLITMWHNAPVVTQGEILLRASGMEVCRTVIRRTDKVDESTFARLPAHVYSSRCSAGRDYLALAAELTGEEGRDHGED